MIRRLPPLALSSSLVALALLAMPSSRRIRESGDLPVKAEPPARIGAWAGAPMRYCQSPRCGKEWHGPETAAGRCPACGSPLSNMSPVEAALLPRDTSLHKALFTAEGRPAISASIVISSLDRSSIHRPEVCLVGQGNELVHSFVHECTLPGRAPLSLTVMELIRRIPQSDGNVQELPTYFAYWFVGTQGRETSSHYRRMAWMAYDRVVLGEASRWAYIAVAGVRNGSDRAYLEDLDTFLRSLVPMLAPPG